MITPLSSLLLALLALLGPVEITLVPGEEVVAYDVAHRSAANPDGAYSARAKARCEAGVPRLVFTVPALDDPTVVAHELLHAVDCTDNGTFDGSPDPTACTEVPGDCLHSWVYWALRHRDEAIARIGRMPRPDSAAPDLATP